MGAYYVLYNPYAGGGKKDDVTKVLAETVTDKPLKFYNILEINDYKVFLDELKRTDDIILCGGDGTLNRFINETKDFKIKGKLYFFPCGSGNDLLNDLTVDRTKPFLVEEYLGTLPEVTIRNKTYKYFNGTGFGLDGFVCYEGNRIRQQKGKINYIAIALRGFLYAFKPGKINIVADGKEYTFNKVWLAPVMKGKYFGGGMLIAPLQDRYAKDNSLSIIVAHDLSKLKIAVLFLSIFKGNHIKYKNHVTVIKCNEAKIKYERPCIMQIDGEAIIDVQEFSVKTKTQAKTRKKIASKVDK